MSLDLIAEAPAKPVPAKRGRPKRPAFADYPGMDAVVEERAKQSAVIGVGTLVDLWDGANWMGQAIITRPYGSQKVTNEAGPYRNAQGPFDVRMGYVALLTGEQAESYFPAWQITPVESTVEYGHLKLVK